MSNPWWLNKEFPPIGTAYFGQQFAIQALVRDALENKQCVYTNRVDGASISSLADLHVKLGELGGRQLGIHGDEDSVAIYYVWDHGMVHIENGGGDASIEHVTNSLEFHKQMDEVAKAFVGPRISAGRVYVLVSTQDGPQFQSIGVAAAALERLNYEEEVLADFDHVVADLQTSTPCGRLVVLDGCPGTGKTFLLRGLLASIPKALFVIVPAHLIVELGNPGMINALMETRSSHSKAEEIPTVFLVEDADDCLTARATDNVNSVSALLNLGDGILGQMFDLRLICTTNAKCEDLDEAVTRPGRLCRYMHVDTLTAATANKIYERLTGKQALELKDGMTLAEVYRIARDEGWTPEHKKAPLGFNTDRGLQPSFFTRTQDGKLRQVRQVTRGCLPKARR